jgi:MarR family transcriptional regulator, organic hydroperoxide resistance regulator
MLSKKRNSRRGERITAIMKYGREESRLSVLFREAIARRFGITASDAECLDILMEMGSANAGDLATITGLTTGAITSLIRRLVKAGLVAVRPDERDRRRVIVRPVEVKIEAGRKLYASYGFALNKLYTRYDIHELELIANYHRQIRDLLSEEIHKLNGDA